MPDLPPRDMTLSASLVDDMVRALGDDLAAAVLEGRVSMDELADLVLRCSDCACPEDCASRLMPGSDANLPPGYCRNRDRLLDLIAPHAKAPQTKARTPKARTSKARTTKDSALETAW